MKYLEIKDLSFSYKKEATIINKLNLKLDKNKILCITGPSGSGKTTLLRIISGLEKPDKGKIFLDKKDITNESLKSRNIGFVFQDYALFPHLTVKKNILYSNSKKLDRYEKLVKLVGLKEHEQKYPYELSGGQQQRVAIARALLNSPKLLLMDEPFSNIDKNTKMSIIKYLKNIFLSENITVIIVTHDDSIEEFNENVFKLC